MLKNYMEDLVDLWLPRIFKEDPAKYADVCKCQTCIGKIKAQALNQLKPFYVTGKVGEIFGEYAVKEMQYKTDLVIALGSAIKLVHAKAHQSQDKRSEPRFESLATLRKPKIRSGE